MTDTDKIVNYLRENLSDKRFKHSLGVAEEAKRLAGHYFADGEKAYLAGLVHDCAKEIPEAEAKRLLWDKYKIVIDPVSMHTPKLLHGPLGACMAQSEFGIFDAEILDAIKYHTTAKADMSLLTKIIYMADYIEPNRTFDGVEELREQAYDNLDRAIIIGLDFTLSDLIADGHMLHPDTVHARNFLLMQKKRR